jgi:hypothetical protein
MILSNSDQGWAMEGFTVQGIEFAVKDDVLHAIVIRRENHGEKKYNFLTPNEFPFQLGVNYYAKGEKIKSHYHVPKTLTIDSVQEFIVINKGKVLISIYDKNLNKFYDTVMNAGDSVLLTAGGHGFEILDETTIVEIKQGPFTAGKDKVIFENGETYVK